MVGANRTEVASLISAPLSAFDSKQTDGLSGGGLKKEDVEVEEACGWRSSLPVQVQAGIGSDDVTFEPTMFQP